MARDKMCYNLKIKKLNPYAQIPTKGTEGAAGYDLVAAMESEVITISSHQTVLVPTGIAMEIPVGYGGFVNSRSGLATKKNLRVKQGCAVIDSDYRGEIFVPLYNEGSTDVTITRGERIAQISFLPYLDVDFFLTNELTDTERGDGGFGSTGEK